ncbi:MAG: NADH-quinone oxidoreductase subunit J [Candidatus Omnitrophica bacterium]|nr:NADH-quinone oxidoreductase subunit J [Candidatus Omnitrophota bacterium]
MENLAFYVFSSLAVISAIYVVASQRPVYGVLALVLTMFALSGLFVLLDAHFLAMIQVLIYAGAILVLFLFILMLLGSETSDENGGREWKDKLKRIVKLVLGFAFLSELLIFVAGSKFLSLSHSGNIRGTIEAIGKALLGEYILPFELVSIVLLVGVIGVVGLLKREKMV